MARKTPEERRAEISQAFQDISNEVPKVFDSQNFKDYLDMSSKFHSYSVNNLIMIKLQKPDASLVAGYQAWQKQFNRNVNKGEKGIGILAPSRYKYTREVDKTDEQGNTVYDSNGNPEKEQREFEGMNFRKVYVFDVSQTSGDPLPQLAATLTGNSKEAYDLLEAVGAVCDVPVNYLTPEEDAGLNNAHGYFSPITGEITVDDTAAYDQKAKTLIHEWAHSRLHGEDDGKSKQQREIEAEATAYVVSKYFGLDTSSYSFEYVAAFAAGKDSKELKDILSVIQKNADEMISSIEETYEKVKEKNKDMELPEAEQSEPEEKENLTEVEEKSGDKTKDIDEPGKSSSEKEGSDGIDSNSADTKTAETDERDSSDQEEDEIEKKIKDIDELWRKGLLTSEEADKMKAETKGEPYQEEKDSKQNEPEEKEPAESKKDTKIEDFGEKIGGARKDEWKRRGLAASDLSFMNDSERASLVKKDNIWPKPNYQKLHDEGLPREVVYFMKAVRDKTPTKPTIYSSTEIAKEQEKYVNFVSAVRDAVMGCKSMSDIRKAATFLQDNGFIEKRGMYYGYSTTEKAGRYVDNKLFKALQLGEQPDKLHREMNKKNFLMSKEDIALKPYTFFPFQPDKMKIEQIPEPVRDFLSINVNGGKAFVYADKGIDLNALKENEWFIVKGSRIIGTGFASEAEARKTVLDSIKEKEADEPEKDTKGRKTKLKPPQLAHIDRTGGEDYLNGKDCNGQMYLDDFGFRGGEFGNWTNQNDRQTSLNMGYEAFKDLAKALNINDKDVGLDGHLAIAFGARGKGSALAHYEPAREVINLTKMKGAGSLGHEWIHAMDDCVGKTLGIETTDRGAMMSESNNYRNRHLIPETFKTLMDTIKYTTLSGEAKLQEQNRLLDTACAEFEKGLNSISTPGKTPELETKRQELIHAVVEEAKTSFDYTSRSIPGKGYRVEVDSTPSPAYKQFADFQREQGDNNPYDKRNRKWANSNREQIGSKNDMITNHPDQIPDTRVNTQFMNNAKTLDKDHSKEGHGYWASDCELLARAGAAYIKDKCAELGIKNDYLSGHADYPAVESSAGKIFTSPQGEERKAINQAFDNFFEELRDREIFHENGLDLKPSLEDVLENADSVADKQETELPRQRAAQKELD